MKRLLCLIILCGSICCLSIGCAPKSGGKGPFSSGIDASGAFSDAVPVEVDDAVIQICLSYINENGYEGNKDATGNYKYKSVRLGEENLPYVYFEDERMKDMVDENDCLIVFGFINIVVDSDTDVVIGRIPLA